MFRTRITDLFGIKYPIICGGMYWIGRAELIAAMANAGGLGFLTAATFETLDDLRAEIRKARDLTDGPIGLNINLFPALRPQPIEAWVEVACEEKIPVVETSGRSPSRPGWRSPARRRYQWSRPPVAAQRRSSRRYTPTASR